MQQISSQDSRGQHVSRDCIVLPRWLFKNWLYVATGCFLGVCSWFQSLFPRIHTSYSLWPIIYHEKNNRISHYHPINHGTSHRSRLGRLAPRSVPLSSPLDWSMASTGAGYQLQAAGLMAWLRFFFARPSRKCWGFFFGLPVLSIWCYTLT